MNKEVEQAANQHVKEMIEPFRGNIGLTYDVAKKMRTASFLAGAEWQRTHLQEGVQPLQRYLIEYSLNGKEFSVTVMAKNKRDAAVRFAGAHEYDTIDVIGLLDEAPAKEEAAPLSQPDLTMYRKIGENGCIHTHDNDLALPAPAVSAEALWDKHSIVWNGKEEMSKEQFIAAMKEFASLNQNK